MVGEQRPRRTGLQVARVVGVPVLLTPSWFLFAALIVWAFSSRLEPVVGAPRAYAAATSYAVLLLLSVLLHELGHCVVARAFGLPVRSITVTLLAGYTEVEKPPQTPAREYAVAVAGPMVSLLLCACGLAAVPLFDEATLPRLVVEGVAATNGIVAAFNLLPGLPLDGGRVLRSVVWHVSGDARRASVVAARAGQVIALVAVPVVLLVVLPSVLGTEPTIVTALFAALLGSWVYAAAGAAVRAARVEQRLPAVSVAALARPALAVPAATPLAEAVRRAHEARAGGVVVVDGADRVEAVVSEAAVKAVPEARRPWVDVGSLARRVAPDDLIDADLSGTELVEALRKAPAAEYVVAGEPGEWRVLVADDVRKALTDR